MTDSYNPDGPVGAEEPVLYDPRTEPLGTAGAPEGTVDAPLVVEPTGDTTYVSSGTTGSTGGSGGSGKADVAKEEAADLANSAADAGAHVAGTAKSEAANVAHEAGTQAKSLLGQAGSELSQEAGKQQQRVADGLRSISQELSSMSDNSEKQGQASDLVRQAAEKADQVADWLGSRDPGSLLNDVKRFARRKPGLFIAIAAGAGIALGRITTAAVHNAQDAKSGSGSGGEAGSGVDTETLYGTDTIYGADTTYGAEGAYGTGTGAGYGGTGGSYETGAGDVHRTGDDVIS